MKDFGCTEKQPYEKGSLNEKLWNGYRNLVLPNFSKKIEEKLSCPFFIYLGSKYKVGEGVFIVGQETHGWGGCAAIGNSFNCYKNADGKCNSTHTKESTLMERQKEWIQTEYQYYIDSDFHNAVKAITGIATGEDFLNSKFVWDNLIAMDCNKGSYRSLVKEDRDNMLIYSAAKLEKELTIAKPRMAIFLIGSYGDIEIWKIFSSLTKKDISEVIPNLNKFDLKLKDGSNKEFTIKCYATSHPSYKGWGNKRDVMKELAKIVK